MAKKKVRRVVLGVGDVEVIGNREGLRLRDPRDWKVITMNSFLPVAGKKIRLVAEVL